MSEHTAPPDEPAVPTGHPLDEETPLGAGLDFTDPDSPLAPFYLRTSHLFAAAILGLIFAFYSQVLLHHTDVWAHLHFGRWIVNHRQLPAHEPFSPFADKERAYAHFQWLTQAGGYLLYAAGGRLAGGNAIQQMEGGVAVLRAAHALLTALRYLVLFVAFWRVTAGEGRPSPALALGGMVLVLLATLAPAAVQRPQVVGELFFALLLLALARPGLSGWALAWVPALFALWVNCHGSYSLGLFLLGLFVLGRGLAPCSGTDAASGGSWLARLRGDGPLRRLVGVTILSTLACLLNPHGPRLFLYTLALGGNPNIPTLVEWQALRFHFGTGGHWVYALTLGLVVVSQIASRAPLSPTGVLLVLTFGVWACLQQRMMVWWLMLVPWILLPAWGEAAGLRERLPWRWVHRESVPSFRKTVVAGLLVGMGLLWSRPAQWAFTGKPALLHYAVQPATPWEVAAQLNATAGRSDWLPELAEALKEYPDGRFTGRVYATETLSDYLTWALPADTPPLIYNHAHLFPEAHWQDCLAVKAGAPWWWEVLDRYRVNLVVIEPGLAPRLADLLRKDPHWVVVRDETPPTWTTQARWQKLLVALRKEPILPAE